MISICRWFIAMLLVFAHGFQYSLADGGCPGEWARGVVHLTNDRQGVVSAYFSSSKQLFDYGKACWGDEAVEASYFQEGVRIVCAPYIRCTPPLGGNISGLTSGASDNMSGEIRGAPDEERDRLYRQWSEMHIAIKNGDLAKIENLLFNKNIDPTYSIKPVGQTGNWHTVLDGLWLGNVVDSMVTQPRSFDIAIALLEAGSDVNATYKHNNWKYPKGIWKQIRLVSVKDGKKHDVKAEDERVLLVLDTLLKAGLRPLRTEYASGPDRQGDDATWFFSPAGLLSSCWGRNDNSEYAIRIFDLIEQYLGKDLVDWLYLDDTLSGTDGYQTVFLGDKIRHLINTRWLPRVQSNSNGWALCLPLAERVDAYLKKSKAIPHASSH